MGTFTLETGLGMLMTGLVVMAIAGTIMYLTVNAMEDNRIKQEQEKKAREKIHGLD
jgi:CHASE3 domain sensor protein